MNSVEAVANRLAESGALVEPGMLLNATRPVACTPVGVADVIGTALAGAGFGYVLGRAAYAHNHGYVDGVHGDEVTGFQGAEATLDELIQHRTAV